MSVIEELAGTAAFGIVAKGLGDTESESDRRVRAD